MQEFKERNWKGLNSVGTGCGTAERSDGTSYNGGAKQYMMHGHGQITWVELEHFIAVGNFNGCGV
jgi:hypothetical protein